MHYYNVYLEYTPNKHNIKVKYNMGKFTKLVNITYIIVYMIKTLQLQQLADNTEHTKSRLWTYVSNRRQFHIKVYIP